MTTHDIHITYRGRTFAIRPWWDEDTGMWGTAISEKLGEYGNAPWSADWDDNDMRYTSWAEAADVGFMHVLNQVEEDEDASHGN